MERGPTMRVDYSDLARASEEPLLPANMGQAPLQALAGLGKDIQGAATMLADVRARQQRHETQAAAYDAELEMDKAQEEHALWREQNPDESQWAADFEQRAAVLRGVVMKDSLNPQAKEAVEARLKRFEELGKIRVQADAARATRQRAKAGWVGMIDRAVRSGDVETAKRTAAAGVQEGFIFEGELPQYEERIDKDIEQKARQDAAEAKRAAIDQILNQAAQSDPQDVMNALDDERLFPALDPSDRAAVRADLRTMHRQQQADAAASVQEMSLTGKLRTVAEVDALELPGLTPGMKEALKANISEAGIKAQEERKRQPDWQGAHFGALLDAVENYDKEADPDGKEYVRLNLLAGELEPVLRGEVTEPLNRKWTGKGAPTFSEEVMDYARASASTMHRRGMFGQWQSPRPDGVGFVVDPKKEIESQRTMSRVVRGVKSFLERNPQADESAVDNEIGRIIGQSADAETVRQMLEETMIQTLTPAPPAEPLGTINEADGLPSGAGGIGAGAEDLLIPR